MPSEQVRLGDRYRDAVTIIALQLGCDYEAVDEATVAAAESVR